MRAVGSNHQVEADFDFAGPGGRISLLVERLEPGAAGPEVGAGQLVVEEELDVGQGAEDVEESGIEC